MFLLLNAPFQFLDCILGVPGEDMMLVAAEITLEDNVQITGDYFMNDVQRVDDCQLDVIVTH